MRRYLSSLVIVPLALVSCSDRGQSPNIDKFVTTELHMAGKHCSSAYLAVRNNNFIYVDGGNSTILQQNVTFSDLGSGKISMMTSYGKLKLVTIFQLSEDRNIAKFAEVSTDPKLTPAQLAQKPEDAALFQSAEKSLMSLPPLEMCPPLIPAKL